MIQHQWDSDNRRFCLSVTIKNSANRKFRVTAADAGKKNSKYADRAIDVLGEKSIYLSFPVSPKQLIITVIDIANPTSSDFEIELSEFNMKDYGVWLDDETRSFVQMAVVFSQISGFTNVAPEQYKLYQSSDGLYHIKYFDVIKDSQGKNMTTPARIGHNTGIIEVAKKNFDNYTIPMRMIILLHEFSHKYKNPKMGLEIENETGADVNALYIYLGLGFSKVDAVYVFANVFYKAQSEGNIKRMRVIMDYINKFDEKQKLSA